MIRQFKIYLAIAVLVLFSVAVAQVERRSTYVVIGSPEIAILHLDYHPHTPLAGRGLIFDVYGQIDVAKLGAAGGTYEQWYYYRGVKLPPEQFMNTYFGSMYWIPAGDQGRFQLYQMSALPFALPLHEPAMNTPLSGMNVQSCEGEILHFTATDFPAVSDAIQNIYRNINSALSTALGIQLGAPQLQELFPLCDAAIVIESLSHVFGSLPQPLHVAVCGKDALSLGLATAAMGTVSTMLRHPTKIIMEASAVQQKAESFLSELGHQSVVRIVSNEMRQLFDDRMLLSAVLVSVRDLDVPSSLYRSLQWLVQGGHVIVCDSSLQEHLPLIWRSMFEAFGKDSYRLVARSVMCIVYEKIPSYPYDRGTDLKLNIEMRQGTSTHLATIVTDIAYELHNKTLSESYPRPLKRAVAVVPCYNCKDTIEGTLQSVVDSSIYLTKHSAMAVDIVVVDDQSTDDSVKSVQTVFQQLQQSIHTDTPVVLHHIQTSVNVGPGAARNAGVRYAADADLIFFCDSDDKFFQHHMHMCSGLVESNPDFGFARTLVHTAAPMDQFWQLAISNTLPLTHCIRRQCYDLIGGFPEHHYWRKREDVWFARVLFAFCSGGQVYNASAEYVNLGSNTYGKQASKFEQDIEEWLSDEKAKDHPLELDPILNHVQALWLQADGLEPAARPVAWHSVQHVSGVDVNAREVISVKRQKSIEAAPVSSLTGVKGQK